MYVCRSLYASKYIRTWDCILEVPYSVVRTLYWKIRIGRFSEWLANLRELSSQQLSKDNLPPDIASLLGSEVSNVAKVALLILYEQKLGQVLIFFLVIIRAWVVISSSGRFVILYIWNIFIKFLLLLLKNSNAESLHFIFNFCGLLLVQNSDWFPYISRLPQPADMHSTVSISVSSIILIFPTGYSKLMVERYMSRKVNFNEITYSKRVNAMLVKKSI